MANQEKMERDLLSCSICLDLLQEPKTLTCMHRFCKSCISSHIVASTAGTSSSKPGFSCPECRAFIPAPDSSSNPSTWAGLLKTDFMVTSMIEIYQSKQESKVAKASNLCQKHRDKEQELYCFVCSAIVCHLCAVISHRACSKIGTVEEAARQRRATWQSYIQQIPLLIQEALEIKKLQENYMKEIRNSKDSVEKEIKETAENMRKLVTNEEEKLLKQVQENYDNLEQKSLTFTEKIKKLESFVAKVSSTSSASSDFDLMVEKDVSLTIDSCSQENQAVNKDFRVFCEALPSVKWRFLPENISATNLGYIEFKCNIPSSEAETVWPYKDHRYRRPVTRKERMKKRYSGVDQQEDGLDMWDSLRMDDMRRKRLLETPEFRLMREAISRRPVT